MAKIGHCLRMTLRRFKGISTLLSPDKTYLLKQVGSYAFVLIITFLFTLYIKLQLMKK